MKKGVALKYNGDAPLILSIAENYLFDKMLEIAVKNNIPIYEDNDLAELLSHLPAGTVVPEDLFKAVAEVFAFCYGINEQFKSKIDLLKNEYG